MKPAPHPAPHPAPAISLRRTTPEDLPRMFELQADPASNAMAGTKPRTREAFFATWDKIFANPRVNGFVIEMPAEGGAGRELVGSIACFQASEVPGEPEIDCVGYWIARSHWGKGIASAALAEFLKLEPRRPLHATADKNNAASRKILERCGFRLTGYRTGEETDRYLPCELADFVLV
jgi:RimJ/RimL family protein N-acetyltransferase